MDELPGQMSIFELIDPDNHPLSSALRAAIEATAIEIPGARARAMRHELMRQLLIERGDYRALSERYPDDGSV